MFDEREDKSEQAQTQDAAAPDHKEEQTQEAAAAPAEERPAEEQPTPPTRGPSGEEIRRVTARERRGMNRRELLKLLPVVAVGAFAIPKLQQPLLNKGLEFSDWVAEKYFGHHRLARTFSNNEVVALRTIPLQLLRRGRSRSRSRQVDTDRRRPGAEVRATTSCRRSRRCPRSCRTRGMSASKAGT